MPYMTVRPTMPTRLVASAAAASSCLPRCPTKASVTMLML